MDSEKGCPTGKDYIQYWNKDDAGRKVRQGIYIADGHYKKLQQAALPVARGAHLFNKDLSLLLTQKKKASWISIKPASWNQNHQTSWNKEEEVGAAAACRVHGPGQNLLLTKKNWPKFLETT